MHENSKSSISHNYLPSQGDFTVSATVNTSDESGYVVGDIFSQYHSTTRQGAGLTVLTNSGGPSSRANYRNLSFYLDDGTSPRWSDLGKPDGCDLMATMAIHRGRLFGGVYNLNGRGRLFEYVAPDEWILRGESPDGANSIQASIVHNGELFVASGCYNGRGSGMPLAANLQPGGSIYRVDENYNWQDCGNPFATPWENQTLGLYSWEGQLYAGSCFHPDLHVYRGDRAWQRVGTPKMAMCQLTGYNGKLFAAPKSLKPSLYPEGLQPPERQALYVQDRGTWRSCGQIPNVERIYTLIVHNGQLHAGSWPDGAISRSHTGDSDWIDLGACGFGPLAGYTEARGEIMAMASYHGKLYVGTLPFAKVYRHEEINSWIEVGHLDATPDVAMRRVWTCAEYDGGLLFSTLPRGKIFRMDSGVGITDPNPFPIGKHHIAAVRESDELKLYVDGVCVASRRDPLIKTLSIGNEGTLEIGKGQYSPFRGRIENMDIVHHALSAQELSH